ncbi:transposase, IS5 family [Rhizobium tibeticum]|uniref:Transposase, IS5 family n=1 Tax=Rhizobium tibeticum TaxID=501024 RepID=A0A1H8W0F5_9HYPH|nr:hypothetical protein RTCCBAU85039_6315 [Rhizobium tibeticum]SEP21085.1 transposase, IS5 family [Rhizobium tibeticum]
MDATAGSRAVQTAHVPHPCHSVGRAAGAPAGDDLVSVDLSKKTGVKLCQTYVRVDKLALIKRQRYAHAKQFKRANKALRTLKTYLGRTVRDIRRQIRTRSCGACSSGRSTRPRRFWSKGNASAAARSTACMRRRSNASAKARRTGPPSSASRSRSPPRSSARRAASSLHAKALPGNPYDGHTLATVVPDIEKTIGNEIERILADAGYRGHNAPESHRFQVFTSGQKRRVTPAIKREMRRLSAVEPVIGHLKAEHRMGRKYLAGEQGDVINAVLATGYNFSLLLNWMRQLLWLMLT